MGIINAQLPMVMSLKKLENPHVQHSWVSQKGENGQQIALKWHYFDVWTA